MTGDTAVLDRTRADAGPGRSVSVRGLRPRGPHDDQPAGEPARFVRSSFTCSWERPGPHEPLLPPRGA